MKKPLILLASKSPRRRQLIEDLGFEYKTVDQNITENFPDNLAKIKVAEYLSKKKAESVNTKPEEGQIILASDTIVLKNNKIYHKPVDYADAVRILKELSGNKHQVITGVCLLGTDKQVSFSTISEVHFASLSPSEIDFYVTKYKPYDKAGAYAIQEWIGLAKIIRIEGSYHNIVGLPTQRVYEEIMKF